jgi:transcriptional regulator with XRE-family HTH domain
MRQFTFGQKLEYYRGLANISKKELGDELGVTGEYIANVETGRTKPPRFELIQLIIKKLNLTKEEQKNLLVLAFEERLKDNDFELFKEIEKLN